MLSWLKFRFLINKFLNFAAKKKLDEMDKSVKSVKEVNFYEDIAPGNDLRIDPAVKVKGSVVIKGQGNQVFFADGVSFNGQLTIQGDNNEITLCRESVVRGRLLLKGKKQKIVIGESTTFGSVYILCQENCDVYIGSWCMFSRDIEIRTTDAHSVVDVKSRQRINAPASVKVGNHVWVGVGSLISKGSQIPNDSIVGAYSFVNKEFTEENVLIAGTPAKIVRHGVTWNRGRKPKFTQAQLEHWKEPPSKTE